jgi:hypothetical protein
MDEGQKAPHDKLDAILDKLERLDKKFIEVQTYEKYIGEMLEYLNKERLEHIDNRINNVKGWVTFIGVVVLLGLIVAILSPVCGGLL